MTLLPKIEAAGCGCDTLESTSLISIDEALTRIARSVRPIDQTEDVPLAAARGRALATPLCAAAPVPPFDNSAMDGYAIDTASLTGNGPWHLSVTARVAAGQVAAASVGVGTAAQIFTGAPMPKGADSVVMQEDVQRSDGGIVVSRKVAPGTHVRLAGGDMAAGDIVVRAGRPLTARDIAVCAAAGAATVTVRRPVRAALLVTGDEVNQAGASRGQAGIWDVNTPMLTAALAAAGITLERIETGKDNRADLARQLATLADSMDLIVTTGGISVGEEDHVKPALMGLGAVTVFSGVAIKPGKPVSFGHLGQTHWLGLPGNPLSAFVTWQLFGTALCRALAGDTPTPASRRHVVLAQAMHHRPGRCELRLARITGFDGLGREVAQFAQETHSGRVADLPDSDGVILIPTEADILAQGALVEFQPFCDR